MTIYPPASLHGVFCDNLRRSVGPAKADLPFYRFTLMAWARERMDQVEVRTITAKRTNSAATLGRSRCAKRSPIKRKARRRMEVFE